jgi:hypothetical protein
MIREWIARSEIKVMNVAGARGRKDPLIYQATLNALDALFIT